MSHAALTIAGKKRIICLASVEGPACGSGSTVQIDGINLAPKILMGQESQLKCNHEIGVVVTSGAL